MWLLEMLMFVLLLGLAPPCAWAVACPKLAAALYAIGGATCNKAAGAAKLACPTTLHLRSAGIDAAGAAKLAAAIAAEAPPIASFSISYNKVGDAGAAAIAKALPSATVTEIGMVGCDIGVTGGRALEAFSKGAKKLYMLCVENNFIGVDVQNALKALGGSSRGAGFVSLRTLVVVPQGSRPSPSPPPEPEPEQVHSSPGAVSAGTTMLAAVLALLGLIYY